MTGLLETIMLRLAALVRPAPTMPQRAGKAVPRANNVLGDCELAVIIPLALHFHLVHLVSMICIAVS